MAKKDVISQKNLAHTNNKIIAKVKGKPNRYSTKESLSVVSESAVQFETRRATGISKMSRDKMEGLGIHGAMGAAILSEYLKPESLMTAFEKMDMVRTGVSKKNLENLKDKADLDYEELARALSVTRATLINKKGEDKFNAALSERIVSLADIYSYGYSVFEDEERFNKWMFRPSQALGGQTPYDLIDNQFGREEVRNIIGRIDYGVYS